MRSITAFIVLALLAACGGADKPAPAEPAAVPTADTSEQSTAGQSYAEAMQAMCDAPNAPGVVDAEASVLATRLDETIQAQVTNQEALDMYHSLVDKSFPEKKATVQEAASKAGIAECRFVDVFATD
jgi:hypothetical protein